MPEHVRWSKQLGFTTTDLDIPGDTMVRFDGYQRLNKSAKITASSRTCTFAGRSSAWS